MGNFFNELRPVCEQCATRPDGELALVTSDGMTLEGEAAFVIEGHCSVTGTPATVRLTDYGFEFTGDIDEVDKIRNARCVYGAVNSSKKGRVIP